jgi:lysophospholipase L1-like esterase
MKRFFLVTCAVLALAGCDLLKNNDSSSNPTTPSGSTFNYTAIGASDAIGVGSSNECLPFAACPNGTGYVQDLSRMYQADHPTTTFTLLNMGIPGATLGPSIQAIGNQLGLGIIANFLTGELPFIQTNGQLVTIFAGGNDARTIATALKSGYGGSDVNGYILAQSSQFGADMNTLINGVKAASPSARIIMLNLPNLAGTPYAAGLSVSDKQVLQTIAVSFTGQINTFASRGVTVVDLMCDSNMYNPAIFSSDGFHPNDQGYAYLAGLIYNYVKGSPAVTPNSSCSQMRLF